MADGTAGTGAWGTVLGRVARRLEMDLVEVVQRDPLLGRWRDSTGLA